MSASDPSALPCLHRLGVVVEAPQHAGLWGPLDYLSAHALPAGTLVRVPFGRRVVTGVVWWGAGEVAPDATIDPTQLKEVIEVLDGLPPLPPAWRQLVRFAASYYQRSLGEMALMVLPPELRQLDATQWERRRKRLDKAVAPPADQAQTRPCEGGRRDGAERLRGLGGIASAGERTGATFVCTLAADADR